jgi:uncharacterized protein YdhG (YjbR/CyaY superfamily)
MKPGPASIDDYIAAQPEAVQPVLAKVRAAIRKALPQAEELLSYNMPTYKADGKPVLYFAGWKRHYSLYPATRGVQEAFSTELRPYEVSKGTIRLPLDEPVPVRLIGRIAKFRAGEVAARAVGRD